MAAAASQPEPCFAKEEPPCTGVEAGGDAALSVAEPAAKEEVETPVGGDAAGSLAEPAAAKEEIDTPAKDGAAGLADGDCASDGAPPAAAAEAEADDAAAEAAEAVEAAADADPAAADDAAEAAEAGEALADADMAAADDAAEVAEAGQAAADADMAAAAEAAAAADADAAAENADAAAEAPEAVPAAAGEAAGAEVSAEAAEAGQAAADADMAAANVAAAADADAAAETADAPRRGAAGAARARGRPRTAAAQPRQAAQGRRARAAAQGASEAPAAEAAGGELVEPKRPTSSYFLWFIENREALSSAAGGGQSAGALAKLAGQRWKGFSPEERAPYEARAAQKKEEYRQALADFLARGGVPMRRARKEEAAPAEQRPAKRPWGGAYGEYLRQHRQDVKSSMPANAQLSEVTRECARRWKELPEELRPPYQERFQARLDEYNATNAEAALPTGVTRSAMATQGIAKGWKVKAWLNCRSAVQFRILEPKQSGRAFRTFNNFKALRGSVDKKIYRQLSRVVKPALIRRLTARPARRAATAAAAAPLQDETPPKRRRASGGEGGALVAAGPRRGRARGDLETPDRLERPLMATQAYPLTDAPRPKDQAWTCGCEAHLVRHRRCAASQGAQQPPIVHLRGQSTSFGRSKDNDVVLNSARFPQMLSRVHAKLERDFSEGGAFSLTDQGSTNGFLVNGSSVQGTCQLRSGDVVTFGVQTAQPEFDYVFETRAEAA